MELKKLKSRKASSLVSDKMIVAIMVAVVIAVILFGLFRFGGWDAIKNLPIFKTQSDTSSGSSGTQNQPLELQKDNPCFYSDYFWADANGNNLNGKTVAAGDSYIAIRFKEDIGNLQDSKNPNYFCASYIIGITLGDNKYLDTSYDFELIQEISKFQNVPGKTEKYYLAKIYLENSECFSKTYSFGIYSTPENFQGNIRGAGYPLFVKRSSNWNCITSPIKSLNPWK